MTVFPTKHSVEETMFKQNWRQNPKSGNVMLTSSSRESPGDEVNVVSFVGKFKFKHIQNFVNILTIRIVIQLGINNINIIYNKESE